MSEVLGEVFGGVQKMLSGKKFPQNVRALRVLVEEVLRCIIEGHQFRGMEDLMGFLEERSQQSKTVKLWVDVVIKPMFITMAYIRAEREGDWLLHLAAFRQMIPYFFAAGHFNYARYGSYYLRSMQKLPHHVVLDHFLKGKHVVHHLRGLWSDQFIESTFVRFGTAVVAL